MLDVNYLSDQITQAIQNTLIPALELAFTNHYDIKTEKDAERAKNFANTIDEMVSGNLGELLANAIDTYFKMGELRGLIVTTGTPVTQQAQIIPQNLGSPMAGAIPNTIGIQ